MPTNPPSVPLPNGARGCIRDSTDTSKTTAFLSPSTPRAVTTRVSDKTRIWAGSLPAPFEIPPDSANGPGGHGDDAPQDSGALSGDFPLGPVL